MALIINIMNFDKEPSRQRKGSDKDVARLEITLAKLGFQLYKNQVHVDLKRDGMKEIIEKFAKDSIHKKMSCSVVVIMTHGRANGLLSAHNNLDISINSDVLQKFSNDQAKDLKGKPKLFLFQACR